MLKLIKRLAGIEPAKTVDKRPPRRSSRARTPGQRDFSEPAPLPDVKEGNDQSDWELWQDSVNSQLQSGFAPSSQNYPDTEPSQLDELDPFSRVSKNRDS